jgi:hypothetical protein
MKFRPILVQIAGGLGNQLFIWQYAHFLERTLGFKVYLLDYYKKDDSRKCELYSLSLNCEHGIKIIKPHKLLDPFKIYDYFYSKSPRSPITQLFLRFIYTCETSHEVPLAEKLKGKFLIRGYFQDYLNVQNTLKYTEIELITHIRRVSIAEDSKFDDLPQQGLHMRRGDFKENETTLGVLSDSYFTNNLESKFPYLIHTDETELQDLGLFKKASRIYGADSSPWLVVAHGAFSKIFIGSNSTLSWWAAFLNNTHGAIIKLPTPWYNSIVHSDESLYLSKARYVTAQFRKSHQC